MKFIFIEHTKFKNIFLYVLLILLVSCRGNIFDNIFIAPPTTVYQIATGSKLMWIPKQHNYDCNSNKSSSGGITTIRFEDFCENNYNSKKIIKKVLSCSNNFKKEFVYIKKIFKYEKYYLYSYTDFDLFWGHIGPRGFIFIYDDNKIKKIHFYAIPEFVEKELDIFLESTKKSGINISINKRYRIKKKIMREIARNRRLMDKYEGVY